MVNVYIGFDDREKAAYQGACRSLRKHSSVPLNIVPLKLAKLAANGLLRRPVDRRSIPYDIVSNANQSTDFAISRFLVPLLCQTGWALFIDSDVVFLADVAELFGLADPDKAVMVVQHNHEVTNGTKMDSQVQSAYPRKNWSSVMLINCDHPANQRLSLQDINERPGRDLHAFYWLHDSEIGKLPAEWNWLVNVTPKPELPKIAHFTLGGPFLESWNLGTEHDDIWLEAIR